jgi:hypothetical protein
VGCAKIRQLLRPPGTRDHSVSCLEDDFGKSTAKDARTSGIRRTLYITIAEIEALRASPLFSLFGLFFRTRN